MPCPHFDIKVVQRSEGQSAVAAAAYQSAEKLYSQYDKETKSYDAKEGITHTEIMLPPNAPREYADRNTLWNAVEEIENQWNSQLEYSCAVKPPIRQTGNRLSGLTETANASLLA